MTQPLPIKLPFKPDESFASHVDRLSHELHVPRRAIYQATGIDDTKSPRGLAGYGAFLTEEHLNIYATATNLHPADVRSSLLLRFDGVLPEIRHWHKNGPLALKTAFPSSWLYVWGSHACPSCLTDRQGAWKITWKLPWVFACLDHSSLLISVCPACGQRLSYPRSPGNPRVPIGRVIARPGTCPNIAFATRRHARECGHPLTDLNAPRLDRATAILDAQQLVLAILNGQSIELLGEQVDSKTFFTELRLLAWTILRHQPPPEYVHALLDCADVTPPPASTTGRKASGAPTHPAVMASVVTYGLPILLAPSVGEAAKRAAPLGQRLAEVPPGQTWNKLGRTRIGGVLRLSARQHRTTRMPTRRRRTA